MKDWQWLLLAVLLFWLFTERRGRQPMAAAGATITNAETWSWVDWEGRTRTAVVHREVKQQ